MRRTRLLCGLLCALTVGWVWTPTARAEEALEPPSDARHPRSWEEEQAIARREQAMREAVGGAQEPGREDAIASALQQPPATAPTAAAPPVMPAQIEPVPPPPDLFRWPGRSTPAPQITPLEQSRPEILGEVTRSGYKKLYKEGIGFQPVRGLGISGRVEIFAEPDPLESLILDTKVLNFKEISQFRRSVLPLFTRAAAGRIVADYEPLPRFTYEFDDREVLHQYQTKFSFKDIDLETHALNALYSFPEIPHVGVLTINPWYKRVLQSSDHDLGAYEHRNETVLNFSLQHSDNVEFFWAADLYRATKTRTPGGSTVQSYKGQVRLRFPELRLFAIPSVEYSRTTFDPGDDEFIKKDFFVDWGMDLADHLRLSSKQQIILTELSQSRSIPSNPNTQVFNWTNTVSYELFKDFDVSLGFDHSRGFGYSNYNNVGLRVEMQLFKAGLVRSKVGYEWLSYYNIQSDLSLLYWKFFLFQ